MPTDLTPVDDDLADALDAERNRQRDSLSLIASENHASEAVLAAQGSVLTNKYAEGQPGERYYGGCEHADAVDTAVMPGCQGGPLMHSVAGKAAGFGEALGPDDETLDPEFDAYARQILDNAEALVDRLQERGFELVSGGTDVHFVLVDFRESHPDLTGADAETALEAVGLVANKQTVPGDPRTATVASGLRVGTPAVTTRGFDADATRGLADAIADVLDAPHDESVRERVRETVSELCAEYPLYADAAPDAIEA
jgi:glycine hydroxymethyltransferase